MHIYLLTIIVVIKISLEQNIEHFKIAISTCYLLVVEISRHKFSSEVKTRRASLRE